jgi:acyl-homoserine lactone synthase
MEVHVVTAANQHLYAEEFDAYLLERHKIYAEEKQWVPEVPSRRERDAFDTDRAVHLIGLEGGRVIAGSRLVPTSEPHLLSEVFPHLCTGDGPIRDERVAEWTRGFIPRTSREGSNLRIHVQFCHAVMEYALSEGITQLGGIQRTYWLTIWAKMNWNVVIRGEPIEFADGPWIPAYFDVTPEALAGAAKLGRVSNSLLVQRGPQRSFIDPGRYWAAAATELNAA